MTGGDPESPTGYEMKASDYAFKWFLTHLDPVAVVAERGASTSDWEMGEVIDVVRHRERLIHQRPLAS